MTLAKKSIFSEDDSKSLYKALSCCFLVQRTYGRQADDLEKTTKIFESLLNGYDFDLVMKAFKRWLEESQDFPTPSDIIKIVKCEAENIRRVNSQEKQKKAIRKFFKENHNLLEEPKTQLDLKFKDPDFRKKIGLEPFGSKYTSFKEIAEVINGF